MKRIFKLTTLLVAAALVLFSCAKNEVDTNQFDNTAVVLKAYGPQPVVRGGVLRFVGSNLDKVVSVTIPDDNVITDITVVSSGVHSEIRVTVPKETAAPGYPVLTLADGKTLTGKTALVYDEPITIDEVTEKAYPGEDITIKGDYLNLIHEVVFSKDVIVSEDEFKTHDRYQIVVAVPETAKTGVIALGTLDETKIPSMGLKEAEKEALLKTLNLIETEEDFVVGTAEGKVVDTPLKPGNSVTIAGSHLDLVKSIVLNGATVEEFKLDGDVISFALPAAVADGDVLMVMASGVEVSAGNLKTVVPVVSGVTPAPVKNGAAITIAGSNLDLVTGLSFVNAEGAEFTFAEGVITATVPEAAQEGDITLTLANGNTVTAVIDLVEPVVTGFSSNPASAGSDVTISGTDLDLVKSVTFGGDITVDVTASETEITVAVPTAAQTAALVLNLKNGSTINTEELAIDKPAGAFISSMPGDLFSPGDMFIVDLENADHLTGVQFDGVDVVYILNGITLYVQIPSDATANTTITLVSDNGSVTYAMNIDPGDFIVTPIWSAGFDCSGWNGNQDLAWGGYDWSTVAPGTILRFELESTKGAGEWFCISLRHGDNWGALAGVPGQYDSPENPLDVVLTKEILDDLVANGGLVITGDGFHLSRVCLVQDLRYGDTIWEGLFECRSWNGDQSLAWGGYDWSTVKAGQTLFFHFASSKAEGEWFCISLRHGDNWGALAGVPGQYDSPESPMGVKLTQEMVNDLVANGGLVITGDGFNLTKVSLK